MLIFILFTACSSPCPMNPIDPDGSAIRKAIFSVDGMINIFSRSDPHIRGNPRSQLV